MINPFSLYKVITSLYEKTLDSPGKLYNHLLKLIFVFPENRKIFINQLKSPAFILLVITNIAATVLAHIENWEIHQVVIAYWVQSLTIIIMIFKKNLIILPNVTFVDLKQQKISKFTQDEIISYLIFYVLHMGGLLSATLYFTHKSMPLGEVLNTGLLFLMIMAAFVFVHSLSFTENKHKDFKNTNPSLGLMYLYPYIRLMPMVMVVAGGQLYQKHLIDFMIAKSIADASMHIIEHYLFQRKTSKEEYRIT